MGAYLYPSRSFFLALSVCYGEVVSTKPRPSSPLRHFNRRPSGMVPPAWAHPNRHTFLSESILHHCRPSLAPRPRIRVFQPMSTVLPKRTVASAFPCSVLVSLHCSRPVLVVVGLVGLRVPSCLSAALVFLIHNLSISAILKRVGHRFRSSSRQAFCAPPLGRSGYPFWGSILWSHSLIVNISAAC